MRALMFAVAAFASTAISAAELQPAPRFSGSGALITPVAKSADQRFAIDAELQANHTQSRDGFTLNARLVPDAKAAGVFCGSPAAAIFSDGFETP